MFLSLALVVLHAAAGEWLESTEAPVTLSHSNSEVDLIAQSLFGQMGGSASLPSPSSLLLYVARVSLPATGLVLIIFDLYDQDPFTVGRPCGLIAATYLALLPLLALSEALFESSIHGQQSGYVDRHLLRRAVGFFCIADLLVQYGFTLLVEIGLVQPSSWLREVLGLVPASDASELFLLVIRPISLLVLLLTIQR